MVWGGLFTASEQLFFVAECIEGVRSELELARVAHQCLTSGAQKALATGAVF
jgi:hypothetical protein